MHVIEARNVCEALPLGVDYLRQYGRLEPSRAGEVLVAPGPVVTKYQRPIERVLFSRVRDANPFFHLAEALWMLVGRRDAAFLNRFVKDFGARFAEPSGVIHGAYGWRWRRHFEVNQIGFEYDQIKRVIKLLRENPNDRQVVLTMWDPAVDLGANVRDRPCNTHIYFRIREGLLDITVCCRSNDIIWGAYGSNAVHFSILQQYLAAMIGVKVGIYYQVSNNYHAYVAVLDKLQASLWDDRYSVGVTPVPLVDNPKTFDQDLDILIDIIDHDFSKPLSKAFSNAFLFDAYTMFVAYRIRKDKSSVVSPVKMLSAITAPDWRIACTEWIQRRTVRRKEFADG